jgi:gliding motility-associated-like protein
LGDGTTVNYSSGFNYNYNTSQTYIVTLIVTNSAGCSDTTSTNAVVLAFPAFNFNTNQTCENSLTQFQVQNVLPGYGFYWDFNNDNNVDATGQQVSYTFPQAGNYIVALIQTSAGGCSDTIRKNISINPKPLANLLSAPQSVCEPQCVTLIADTGNLYYWQVNNEIKTGNVTMWCLPPGNYSIKLKAVNSFGCSDSTMFNQYITVYQKPTADFLVINNEADWSAPEIEFQLSNPLPHTVYTVNYGDSTIVNYNNLSSFYHLYNDTGNFLVQVVAINQHQCSDTAYNNVKITPAFSVYIPNAFTPNSDVLNPIFKPICNGIDRNGYLFRIYDRWGCMLFETTNPDEGWDSKYKGKLCPIDHYAYTLRVIDYRGKEREFYGTVTLVR